MRSSRNAIAACSESASRLDGFTASALSSAATGVGLMILVEGELGEDEVRRHERRVDGEGALGQVPRGLPVLVGECAREPDQRGWIAAVAGQRRAERSDRFGLVLLFEEELSPRDLQIRVVANQGGRVAKQGVRLLVPSEQLRGARRAADDLAHRRCAGRRR